MLFQKQSPHQDLCLVFHLFVAGLLLFASVAAFVGVYKAHIQPDGLIFGTVTGSLSLLAFGITVSLWLHHMKLCVTECAACGIAPDMKKKVEVKKK